MNRLLDKLGSGRFIFTICSAVVFMSLSLTNQMPADKIYEILFLVIMFYFNRPDRNKGATQ